MLMFLCVSVACYSEASHYEYRGWHSTTVSGKTCQPWAEQSPHQHNMQDKWFPDGSLKAAKNFCRDPDNETFLWCYTTDPGARMEPCDIRKCGQGLVHFCIFVHY